MSNSKLSGYYWKLFTFLHERAHLFNPTHLARLDYVFVKTDNGEALRVVVVQQDLTERVSEKSWGNYSALHY